MKSADNIQALIIDMDGVLWRGLEPLGDLPALFAVIDKRGWKFTLATNNATRSIDQYLQKLRGFGVDIDEPKVINSALATALYLRQQYPQGEYVYIIGEEGLEIALADQRFVATDENHVVAVVVGLDRSFTYEKLRQGTLYIRGGAEFVGTNPDRTFPMPGGQLEPGTGSILAALEAATDQQPTIIGKPNTGMYQAALDRMKVLAENTLVIGDRLETDIAGGQAMGCPTALLLSGVTTLAKARAWQPRPDYIFKDLTELLASIA